jgi:putative ABC transport system permease protein
MSRPPRLARALLERFVSKNDPLVGDLLEEFAARPSSPWFWRQVAGAILFARRRRAGEARPLRAASALRSTATSRGYVLGSLLGDFKFAGRALRGAPVPTTAAVLTLALGIGTTTAIFSVANGLLLRPLDVKDPDRLVTVTSATALRFGFTGGAGWNYRMWDTLRPRANAFDGAFAWTLDTLNVAAGGPPQPAQVLAASGDLFPTLGVAPLLGRGLTPADDVRGGGVDGPVVVVSDDFWRRRLAGAPSVLGSQLSVEGVPFTIVGVTPPGFLGVDVGQAFDITLPLGAEPLIHGPNNLLDQPSVLSLTVMLRLKPKQSNAAATAALRAMQPQIMASVGDTHGFMKEPFILVSAATGISDRTGLRQRYEAPLVALWIISCLALTIASLNVANLMLARTAVRRHELALRLALGASRLRLAQQMFAESLIMALFGTAIGAACAVWFSHAMVSRVLTGQMPIHLDVPVDWRVLAFLALVTVASVVLFGTWPAFRAARVDPLEALQDHARSTSARRWRPLSNGLIVVQATFSMVLLTAVGLFVGTFIRLTSVPLGFDAAHVLIVDVDSAGLRAGADSLPLLYRRSVEAVAAVPGIDRAAASMWTPLSGGGGVLSDARGRTVDPGVAPAQRVAYNFVTPGWFDVYGIALRAGRDFQPRDGMDIARVAIINEALGRRMFAGRQAVGESMDAGPCQGCRVIGIVTDAVYGRSLRDAPPPTLYLPLAQSAGLTPSKTRFSISLRATARPDEFAANIGAALRSVDPDLAVSVRPLRADVDAALTQERLVAMLASLVGSVALLLSAIGLYGVTSYSVIRRRMEIGIRLALGAEPRAAVRLVLRRVLFVIVAGLASGTAMSVWLSRFVAPLLYGVQPRSPVALATAAATLAGVGLVSAWLPARHAARVDPATVLRES